MKVVGEAKVEKIVEGRPEKVWEQTKSEAGIEEKIYFDYYTEKTNAVAYQLIEIKKYSRPRSISVSYTHLRDTRLVPFQERPRKRSHRH